MGFLPFLSGLLGWVYFFCWSASFYPQVLLNWRRQSTTGSTVDYPLINILGHSAYLTSNAAFLWSPVVRAQYAARHHGLTPTVQFNDVTFALHATILSFVTTSQYLLAAPLWGFARSPRSHRPSRLVLGIGAGCIVGVVVTCIIVAASAGGSGDDAFDPARDWCELDIVYAVGYVKLLITLVKYAPQVVTNVRNRSTEGWSIGQILLDLGGGLLSVAQQGIDSYLQGDWSGITGNPVKFALGNVSMVYDVVFVVQHYIVYPQHRPSGAAAVGERGTEEERLLPGDEERGRRID